VNYFLLSDRNRTSTTIAHKSLSKTPCLIPVRTRYFPHVLGDNIASIQLEFKFGKIQDRDQFILVYMYVCNTST